MSSDIQNGELTESLLSLNVNSPTSVEENHTSSLPLYNWEKITDEFLRSCEGKRKNFDWIKKVSINPF